MKALDEEQKKELEKLFKQVWDLHKTELAHASKPKDDTFDLTIYKHVYFVSWIGLPRTLAGFFGERKVGNRIITLNFLLDNDAALKEAERVLIFSENLKDCSIMNFMELEAY